MTNWLDKLEAAAKAATPGPWHADMGNGDVESHNERHYRSSVCDRISLTERDAHYAEFSLDDEPIYPNDDMDFIALANPQTMEALIDVVKAAEDMFERLPDELEGWAKLQKALKRAREVIGSGDI